MATKKMGFNKLSTKVTKSYEKKGVSPKQAEEIGEKVAGKVKAEKSNKMK